MQRPAEASGKLTLGGDLAVYRLGFGAMRITDSGIWRPPPDKQEVLRLTDAEFDTITRTSSVG